MIDNNNPPKLDSVNVCLMARKIIYLCNKIIKLKVNTHKLNYK